MNKQPFYHRVDGLLFTSTTGFGKHQFLEAFAAFARSEQAKDLGIIDTSLDVEEYDEPEAGDPADLL